jgi:hypothetical protein
VDNTLDVRWRSGGGGVPREGVATAAARPARQNKFRSSGEIESEDNYARRTPDRARSGSIQPSGTVLMSWAECKEFVFAR